MKTGTTAILRLDAETVLPAEAGKKAMGLQELMRFGRAVPGTWVILPSATPDQVSELSQELVATGAGLLAVRSSGIDEDDVGHSFAGVHETLLGIRPELLERAVTRVSRSAASERAREYRRALGLPAAQGPCAVIVQRLVPARVAGVAFGRWGGAREVVIEAAAGLGESVVAGTATPEVVEVRPVGDAWEVRRRGHARQPKALYLRRGEVVRVALADQGPEPLLAPASAREIAETVVELQWNLARPLDLEWAESQGRIWWLQMRPQSRPLSDTVPRDVVWSRANLREVLPDIPSAFTRSLLATALGEGIALSLRRYGIVLDGAAPVLTHVYGRPVLNEVVLTPGDRLGVPRSTQKLAFGGGGAPSDPVAPVRLRTALRHPRLLWRATRLASGAEREGARLIGRIRRVRADLEGLETEAVDGCSLMGHVHEVMALGRDFTACQLVVAGALMSRQYGVFHLLRRHPRPSSALALIMAPGDKTVSTEMVEGLEDIAVRFGACAGVREVLERTLQEGECSYDEWGDALPAQMWSRIRSWLEAHGHRGPFESDIAWPRYAEDARLLAALLVPLVRGTPRSPVEREAVRKAAAAEAWEAVRRHCGPRGVTRIRKQLGPLRRLIGLRERLRSEMIAAYRPLRVALLRFGSDLAAAGRLREATDLWHLEVSDLARAVADPAFRPTIAVDRERSRLRAWRRVRVPNEFHSADIPSMPRDGDGRVPAGRVLRGDGISPGLAEGPACVLSAPDDGLRLTDGAILVAPATDPAWTPLFTRASGVITELGGMLSHAGIVARELGIPAVANVQGATRKLHDGDVVRIDGSSGRVDVQEHEGH
jgi:phosphohistidine swiveling domain-containing protein